ncbi:uncharacterized protein V3H82_010854 isoform 4-T4 [Fundulus diaphanus]
MNIHHSLFCFFIVSLQVRNCGSATALKNMYGAAGEDVSFHCGLYSSESWKIFCRENCEGGNILIRTKESKAQSGRYSTECVTGVTSGWFALYVSISGLTQSDSGRYRCGVGKSLSSASYQDFRLVLVDVDPSVSTPPPRTSISSSSGSYTPSVSSETTDLSVLTQWSTTTSQDAANRGSAEVLRFVALTLVIIIILLSVALLVCCRKRSEKHHTALLVQTENATESYRIKEDVREEDQQWRSADVEIYVAYRETTTTKPTEAETSQSCSSATATTSQHQAEDDWNKVIYAEVKFSNKKTASAPRSSCGTMTDVIYAEPQVAKTSHDEPLHSNAA